MTSTIKSQNLMTNFTKSLIALAALVWATTATFAQAPLQYRVDTIDSLLNITLYGADAKVTAWVGGSTARDNGGGGVFFYDGNSAVATNVYAVYLPKHNSGRWFKLPTAVAIQNGAATVGTSSTYAWQLMRNAQTNVFSIGADDSNVYLQSNSKTLQLNNQGNNTILNGASGNVGIGTASPGTLLSVNGATGTDSLAVTNAATAGTLAVGGGSVLRAIYSAAAQLDFPSVTANSVTNLTITVTGAGTNSTVSVSEAAGTGGANGVSFSAYVSATNTVTVRCANGTLDAWNPASTSYRVVVFQY
jgi:hypothetical protein